MRGRVFRDLIWELVKALDASFREVDGVRICSVCAHPLDRHEDGCEVADAFKLLEEVRKAELL